MRQVADRLSVRWYVGYDLDELLPDYSTLSKIAPVMGSRCFGASSSTEVDLLSLALFLDIFQIFWLRLVCSPLLLCLYLALSCSSAAHGPLAAESRGRTQNSVLRDVNRSPRINKSGGFPWTVTDPSSCFANSCPPWLPFRFGLTKPPQAVAPCSWANLNVVLTRRNG